MKVKGQLPLSERQRLERCEQDADRVRRLRIVILGLESWTALSVAIIDAGSFNSRVEVHPHTVRAIQHAGNLLRTAIRQSAHRGPSLAI